MKIFKFLTGGIPPVTKNFSKIDPYLKNFLTYHPTLNSAIDRSRRALQLCSGGRGEWVKSHLHFLSIFEKSCHEISTSSLIDSGTCTIYKAGSRDLVCDIQSFWTKSTHISKTFSPTTPLWIAQSTDLGELYNFVVGTMGWSWGFTYDFYHFGSENSPKILKFGSKNFLRPKYFQKC